MFLKISQELSGITRDCKFFCREKFKPVLLGPATSANRPAELAKSVIFDEFPKNMSKKAKTSKFFILAKNGRFDSNLLKTLYLGPKDPILICISCQFIFYDFLWYFEFWSFLTFFWKKKFFQNFQKNYIKNGQFGRPTGQCGRVYMSRLEQ